MKRHDLRKLITPMARINRSPQTAVAELWELGKSGMAASAAAFVPPAS